MISVKQDLPLYDGRPIEIGATGWLLLMGSLVVAFLSLTLIPLRTFPSNLVPALLFTGIPLLALARVAGAHWTCLFRPMTLRSTIVMVLFGAATLLASLAMSAVLQRFFEMHANPVSDEIAAMTSVEIVTTLAVTGIQLVGEELFGIMTFLAILWVCVRHLHLSRVLGIAVALLLSGLLFGAAHLPTYDWHWAQALIGIGFARVILTLAFIATRNLWVSAGAHIINDWTGFLLVFEFGHVPIDPTA